MNFVPMKRKRNFELLLHLSMLHFYLIYLQIIEVKIIVIYRFNVTTRNRGS